MKVKIVRESLDESYSDKDKTRIEDIVKKAAGSSEKELSLSQTMANSIKDVDKSFGRAEAAKDLGKYEIAKIFLEKAKSLSTGIPEYERRYNSIAYDVNTHLRDVSNRAGFDDHLKKLEGTETDKDGIFYNVGIPVMHKQAKDDKNVKAFSYALKRIVQHLAGQTHVWIMPKSYDEQKGTLAVQVSPNFTYPRYKVEAAYREYPKMLANHLNKAYGEGTVKPSGGTITFTKDVDFKKLVVSVAFTDMKYGEFPSKKPENGSDVVRESLAPKDLPKGTALTCVNPGLVNVVSGDEARSADVHEGDEFVIGDSPNPHHYFGTLRVKGTFKRDPGLSGKDPQHLSKIPIDTNNVIYGVSRDNVDGHEDDFWATFVPKHDPNKAYTSRVGRYSHQGMLMRARKY